MMPQAKDAPQPPRHSSLKAQVKDFYWHQIETTKIDTPRLDALQDKYGSMAHNVEIGKIMETLKDPSLTRQQKTTKLNVARDLYELGNRKTRLEPLAAKKVHYCKHCKKHHKKVHIENTEHMHFRNMPRSENFLGMGQ